MHSTGTQHIEKLTADNYETWRLQMRSVLVYNGLWGHVSGSVVKPVEEAKLVTWTIEDEKALALIVFGVSSSELGHIRKAVTASEAWSELERAFNSRGPVRKAVLYRQLYQMKKDPEKSMSQYVSDFMRTADQLDEAGIKVPSELLSIMLLSSLPQDFENFRVAIESRDEIPDINFLKAKLIEEEARRVGSDREKDRGSSALLTAGKSDTHKITSRKPFGQRKVQEKRGACSEEERGVQSFEGKCFKCRKTGHRASDCWKKKGLTIRP
ncbi:uncharacterized protein [Temnothorax longispinosus]|uniref:uncharacterized protein n=1 Tax=Temnothorax longispinosus TaxID=300112 RepID=UPI003A9A0F2A